MVRVRLMRLVLANGPNGLRDISCHFIGNPAVGSAKMTVRGGLQVGSFRPRSSTFVAEQFD
jgi:hypothetical protein